MSIEDRETANRDMKGSSTLVILREMQIRTAVNHHLTPATTVVIKKTRNIKCSQNVD